MLETHGSERKVLVHQPEYTIYEQEAYGRIWLHLDFRGPWSKSVLDKGFYDMSLIRKLFGIFGKKYLWVCIPDGDPKLLKFEKLFGFEEVGRAPGAIFLRLETT